MSADAEITIINPAYRRGLREPHRSILLAAGRVLIGVLFAYFGFLKLTNWGGSVAYFSKWGFSWAPSLGAGLAVLFELGGGVLLIAGWKTRWVAAALVPYLAATVLIVHTYWTYEQAQVFNQMSHFYKNLAIMGAMLCIAAVGPGRYSVDKA